MLLVKGWEINVRGVLHTLVVRVALLGKGHDPGAMREAFDAWMNHSGVA